MGRRGRAPAPQQRRLRLTARPRPLQLPPSLLLLVAVLLACAPLSHAGAGAGVEDPGAAAKVHALPAALLSPPAPLDPRAPRIRGEADLFDLPGKPRAVLGYLSDQDWAFMEFLSFMHTSWRFSTKNRDAKLDLFAFAHPRWAKEVSRLCTVLDLDMPFEGFTDVHSQCFVVFYPPPPEEIWHGYPFINNVHFFADDRVAAIMTRHYGYIMKSDFDALLTPRVLAIAPDKIMFGTMNYQIATETAERLVKVAGDLGLTHHGRHNLGPTWMGPAADVVELGNRTIPVLHHILTKEFEQKPEGGVAQKWFEGEGFPYWSAGIAAMYATEIVANHFVDEYEVTPRMDVNGDALWPTQDVIHIHCQHGDKEFNKFEFFKHHYDAVDIASIDISTVRGYTTKLSVATYRALVGRLGGRPPKQEL